jgi:hypothetical protein
MKNDFMKQKKNKLIICCAVNRSGSTWTYQLVKELLKESSYTDLSYLDVSESNKIIDALKHSKLPVVVKMHYYAPQFDSLEEIKNARLIYSHRDIRDIIVSLSRKTNRPAADIVDMPFLEKAIDCYPDWSKHQGYLPIDYTLIRNKPSKAVMKIANHINCNIPTERAVEIAEKLSLENQKKRIAKMRSTLKGGILALLQRANILHGAKDRDTLLHYNHIQSGEVNEWKKVLTYEESERIVEKYKNWMKELGYKE